ncbi:hypothetical protein D9756_001071 [Leucocoprinus leucothites]|uniref:Fungal-type protein kinase domain-containing protein n=1 Tax=Leucocoprinus leucothites TaxID=201217 RepID=A0A8H5GEC0_9AGAR|nr:hypothetical protein D9756_001071 [Leucoagaricus leucothites]
MAKSRNTAPPMDRPTTPESSVRSKPNSLTPRTPKEDPDARQVGINHRRKAVAEAMVHEILECSVETFLDHYAPFKPSPDSIEAICQKLKHEGLLVPTTHLTHAKDAPMQPPQSEDSFGWNDLEGCTPSKIIGTEQGIFKTIEEIVEAVVEPSSGTNDHVDGHRPNYQYKDCPNGNMIGEIQGATFRLDACIIPKNSPSAESTTVNTWEAAVIAEFKRGEQSEIDNRKQLVSAASFIMNDDPRRMWMYGITIEDASMSLWYFSRSHSVKSLPFDFTKDYRAFVHVFLSFLYAEPDKMGFDPTVHRVFLKDKNRKEKTHYIYEIGPRNNPQFYRTTRAIFNPDVLCITGRKTRVWEAVRVAGHYPGQYSQALNGGRKYAIKNVWLNEGARTEREILNAVFTRLAEVSENPPDYDWSSESLQAVITEALRDGNYKKYFMNIVTDSRGFSCRAPPQGVRHNSKILWESLKELTPAQISRATDHRSSQRESASLSGSMRFRESPNNWSQQPLLEREYKAKQQYRLVYSDVGQSLHNSKDFPTAFHAIQDVFIALVLLFLANWMHRDVSTGNIIVIEKNGKVSGKLSDLEYAKEFCSDQAPAKDPKTGTPFFMPYEMHSGQKIYIQPPVAPTRSDFTGGPSAQRPVYVANQFQEETLIFRFSYDLESLWWIMLWFFLARLNHLSAYNLARCVFTYGIRPSDMRGTIFKTGSGTSIISTAIAPELTAIYPLAEQIRVQLLISHAQVSPNSQDYAILYGTYWWYLCHMVTDVEPLKDLPFIDVENPDTRPTVATDGEKSLRPSTDAHDDAPYVPNSDSRVPKRPDDNTVEGGEEGSSKRQRTIADTVKARHRHPSNMGHRIYTP